MVKGTPIIIHSIIKSYMKKNTLLVSFTLVCFSHGWAQMVAEDAKGQSSILYKNANIGLNLTEASLSASINNFRKIHVAEKPHQFLWQLSATGKNEEGLGLLLNEGNLQAASRMEGFIGFRFR